MMKDSVLKLIVKMTLPMVISMMVVCIGIMRPFLTLFTKDAQVIDMGVRYARIAFLFAVGLSWQLVFEKIFQAVGRMVESMVCIMAGAIINIILDPIYTFRQMESFRECVRFLDIMFTTNAQTVQVGSVALRVICIGFVVSSISVTSCGSLEGLGKGGPSLLISLCRYVFVIVPAAFALSRIVGVTGVWHAFWVTEVITAVISAVVYRRAVS